MERKAVFWAFYRNFRYVLVASFLCMLPSFLYAHESKCEKSGPAWKLDYFCDRYGASPNAIYKTITPVYYQDSNTMQDPFNNSADLSIYKSGCNDREPLACYEGWNCYDSDGDRVDISKLAPEWLYCNNVSCYPYGGSPKNVYYYCDNSGSYTCGAQTLGVPCGAGWNVWDGQANSIFVTGSDSHCDQCTKSGHYLDGWKCYDNNNNPVISDLVNPGTTVNWEWDYNGLLYCYANWEPVSCGGIDENTGETLPNSIIYSLGTYGTWPVGASHPAGWTYETAFNVSNPERPGHRFDGWVISGLESNVTHYYGSSNPPATPSNTAVLNVGSNISWFKNLRASCGDITFTAVWTAYTVTYTQDGSCSGNGAIIAPGTSPYTLLNPAAAGQTNATGVSVPSGYTFNGWTLNGSPVSGSINLTDNITLVGSCTQNTYNVTYDCGSGTGNPPTDSNNPYTSGATVTVLGQGGCLKTNNTFNGWVCSINGVDNIYQQNATFTITQDVTCSPRWRECAVCNQGIGCTCVLDVAHNHCRYTTGAESGWTLVSGPDTATPVCSTTATYYAGNCGMTGSESYPDLSNPVLGGGAYSVLTNSNNNPALTEFDAGDFRVFRGWATTPGGSVVHFADVPSSVSPVNTSNTPLNFYGVCDNLINITWDGNGGTFHLSGGSAQSNNYNMCTYGDTTNDTDYIVVPILDTAPTGYIFTGWKVVDHDCDDYPDSCTE